MSLDIKKGEASLRAMLPFHEVTLTAEEFEGAEFWRVMVDGEDSGNAYGPEVFDWAMSSATLLVRHKYPARLKLWLRSPRVAP